VVRRSEKNPRRYLKRRGTKEEKKEESPKTDKPRKKNQRERKCLTMSAGMSPGSLRKSQVCSYCNSTALTNDWSGYVVIIDPDKSQIAKNSESNYPGSMR